MPHGSGEDLLFVYGTLKPGGRYHHAYCDGRTDGWTRGWTSGDLYHLPGADYPAAAPGVGRVWGYLCRLTVPGALADFDELEGVGANATGEYYRELVPVWDEGGVALGRAWVYRMDREQILARGGVAWPLGVWESESG